MTTSEPHCMMLVGYSSLDPTPDVECGKPACYQHGRDHFCCAECYELMREHDAELVEGYVKLPMG